MIQKVDRNDRICITVDQVVEHGYAALESKVMESGGLFDLEIPLSTAGSTQEPWDIARDYVDALFAGEMLAPFCDSINNTPETTSPGYSIRFEIQASNLKTIAKTIYRLIIGLFNEDGYDDALLSDRADLEDQLYWQDVPKPLRFPELADDYMANLLHASAPWEDEECVNEYRKLFPETEYGFWKSFLSPFLKYDLYVSTFAWIVPPNSDVKQALRKYGFWDKETPVSLLSASIMSTSGLPPILVNESSVVHLPSNQIKDAVSCSQSVDLFEHRETLDQQWLLSTTGDVAVYLTNRAQHIVFCDTFKMDDEDAISKYLSASEAVVHNLRRVLGIEIHTRCEWDKLDDETFEQLCYDVTCRNNLFDPRNIRKMGQARSRDGGRDIVAFTKARPGHPPLKWIIQCKFLKSKKSLSGSMIQMSDVIDQYGAMGFAVMTNAVIDATLFDKLESICSRRGIEHQTWSGMEIERFLQGQDDLLKIYFGIVK